MGKPTYEQAREDAWAKFLGVSDISDEVGSGVMPEIYRRTGGL